MMMKCAAVCLVALCLLGGICEAQYGGKPAQQPNYQVPQPPAKEPQRPQQNQQVQQTFEKPLTWSYPEPPKPEVQPEVPFELRYPVPAATVAVECRERDALVEVKKDMFGIGQLINPSDLTLGNCNAAGEDAGAQVLIFQSELHLCGSITTITDDSFIYTFTLNYDPQRLGGSPVVRTSKAAVIVECHYPRNHNVSSLPLDPMWIPFSAVKVAEEFLYFTLKLMTDDWQYERPSYQYFLGDLVNIEASVKTYFHVPLRVYVESCVATLAPDANSEPRYAFIDNMGCFVDARLTGSSSRFLARTAEHKLQFQLEAFRFQGADSGLVYITCNLKATSAAHAIEEGYRACSYRNGWTEANGVHAACGSCESAGFPAVAAAGSSGASFSPGGGSSYSAGGGGSYSAGGGGSFSSGGGGSFSSGGGGSFSSGGGSSFGGYGGGGSGHFAAPGRKQRSVAPSDVLFRGVVMFGPIEMAHKVVR